MSKNHIVQQGECLSRIASRYGFTDWRFLYDHPANAELRRKRPNPNVLFPGDVVVIPAPRVKEERIDTTRLHTFVVKAPRKFLRIIFKNPKGEPLPNEPYLLRFDSGRSAKAATSSVGLLHEPVFPHESTATLEITGRTLFLHLGHLNPNGDVVKEDLSGIQARLTNLGYAAGPVDGIYGRNTRSALALLQHEEDLPVSGLPDPDTLSTLEKLHGC